jgi:tetratricopeptide (TPR) repeat protein
MPVVFFSYSHDSDAHHDKVASLAQRLRTDGFDSRLDQFLAGGPAKGWPRWVLDQLDAANFVLVICTEIYYRRFRGHEIRGQGKGGGWEGALITSEIYHARSETLKFLPLIFSEGDEAFIPEPLRGLSYYLLSSEGGYLALLEFLGGQAGIEPAPIGMLEIRPRRTIAPISFPFDQRISPSRLPKGAKHLFGRDRELADLESAWRDLGVRVLTFVAWGGVGKTSLIVKWAADLAKRGFDGADYFDWSFYSQGTKDHSTASGDVFLQTALRFFGDEAMADSARGSWEKGARLAELVARRKTLLVLDGLEPLQHGEGSPLEGELKDPGIRALLKGLAARNAGLCVVTTREKVADLESWQESTFRHRSLEHLSLEAGLELLKSLGVHGAATDLSKLVADMRGHALTLNLLGSFLRDAHGGDVRRRDLVCFVEADAESRNGHAFKVMAAYDQWFEAEGAKGRRELAVLRLLGLFDRAASNGCMTALRKEPAIPGLTESIVGLSHGLWRSSLRELEKRGLIAVEKDGSVDAHPLIREFSADQLRTQKPDSWRVAHGRLFKHLTETAPYRPEGLGPLQPLYQSVFHGCQAGLHQETCSQVYRDRIHRGKEFYSLARLGAFSSELGALACFFEKPWSRVAPSLPEADQAWLLNEVAFMLRAVGRLPESVELLNASLEAYMRQENWEYTAKLASNLCELELILGQVDEAITDGERSIVFADRSGDLYERIDDRTLLADALHQKGKIDSAQAFFQEAESLQAEWKPQQPLLHSLRGFRHCDLKLARAERAAGFGRKATEQLQACAEVNQLAARTGEWAEQIGLLAVALDHLTIGRAGLYRVIVEGRGPDGAADVRAEIELAVNGLRAAGDLQYLPFGLLTRAWLCCFGGDPGSARADLDEAYEIAERGSMKLHLADVALYRARLFRGRAALDEARRLVTECSYGRRVPEIADLDEIFATGRLLPWHPGFDGSTSAG